MNSMHNSFNGPGGYSGAYSGYVPPPSALPYYNGYAGEPNQCSTPYYGKPGVSSLPPNYGIGNYPSSINNSSMYYQQYGIGYQYGYGKYGIGYPGEPNAHHQNVNTMQPSASTDLGPIGSMFSKGKYSDGQNSSSPHSGVLARNQSGSSILSPATSGTPSPGPQNVALNFKGTTATPSPPVDVSDTKKDLDKMKKCQICGQVFHLMSECLAHMKSVHDNPSDSYMQHMINRGQSPLPGNNLPSQTVGSSLPHSSTRYASSIGPDSPLTALEKMGWGEKQGVLPHSSSSPSVSQAQNQLAVGVPTNCRSVQEYGMQYPLHHPTTHSMQRLSSPSLNSSIIGANTDRTSISHLEASRLKIQQPSVTEEPDNYDAKHRKPNSHSVSSIIGESASMTSPLQRNFVNMTNSQGTITPKSEGNNEKVKIAGLNVPSEPNLQTTANESAIDFTKPTSPLESKEDKSDLVDEPSLPESVTKNEIEDTVSDKEQSEHLNNNLNDEQTGNFETSSLSEPEDELPESKVKLNTDGFIPEENQTNNADVTLQCDQSGNDMRKNNEKMEEENKEIDLNKRTDNDSSETNSNANNAGNVQEITQTKSSKEVDKPLNTTNVHPMTQAHQYRLANPSSMSNVYPNSGGKQSNFGNWPMNMNSGYPGHFPYPSNQPNQSVMDGNIKPHGYSIQPRYPMHYQQNQMCIRNTCGQEQCRDGNIPGFIQNHSQNTAPGWYANNSRSDGKPLWGAWPTQPSTYGQGFYNYPSGTPQGQKHPSHMHPISAYPSGQQQPQSKAMPQGNLIRQSQPAAHLAQKIGQLGQPDNRPLGYDNVKSSPILDSSCNDSVAKGDGPHTKIICSEHVEGDQSEKHTSVHDAMDKFAMTKYSPGSARKTSAKIGPKSKIMFLKQADSADDIENYSIMHENNIDGDASQSATSQCDSSDSEMVVDDGPTYAVLRTLKKRNSLTEKDGVFVGPKRIKLAKLVQERQKKRKKHLQEQIHQIEIEERLQAERTESLTDREGPLANIILQSSIILADKSGTSSDSVAIFMASMNAEKEKTDMSLTNDGSNDKYVISSYDNLVSMKRPILKKSPHAKVFHNENSVLVRHSRDHPLSKKLRAKDFKWSHYVKTTRYWCNDCTQGFKNQKEANAHTEDKCKLNCLYMLECYVVVKDVQNHPEYGPKVQVLLEEYQIDGNHECTTCGDVIARKADLLVHADTHKDFMPWECTICGTRFKIRGSLKEHLRYTHMKGRVPCLKCNKVFPTSTLLRQHVKVHTQHYKYKSGKNRKDELRVAMEATAGALEPGLNSPEENERLSSQEATEYRSWCKLMEMNAMKNIATYGTGLSGTSFANNFDEDFDEKDEGNMSCDELIHLEIGHGEPNDSS